MSRDQQYTLYTVFTAQYLDRKYEIFKKNAHHKTVKLISELALYDLETKLSYCFHGD